MSYLGTGAPLAPVPFSPSQFLLMETRGAPLWKHKGQLREELPFFRPSVGRNQLIARFYGR